MLESLEPGALDDERRVSRGAADATVSQRVASCDGKNCVSERTPASRQQSERQHLRWDVSARRIDELREEREEEYGCVRVEHDDDDALREHAAKIRTHEGDIGHRRLSPDQRLNAQNDQGRAPPYCTIANAKAEDTSSAERPSVAART
jgi:hypothetical protein